MSLSHFHKEVGRLIERVRQEATDPSHPYTKGYLDALIYVLEWLEEIEED